MTVSNVVDGLLQYSRSSNDLLLTLKEDAEDNKTIGVTRKYSCFLINRFSALFRGYSLDLRKIIPSMRGVDFATASADQLGKMREGMQILRQKMARPGGYADCLIDLDTIVVRLNGGSSLPHHTSYEDSSVLSLAAGAEAAPASLDRRSVVANEKGEGRGVASWFPSGTCTEKAYHCFL